MALLNALCVCVHACEVEEGRPLIRTDLDLCKKGGARPPLAASPASLASLII